MRTCEVILLSLFVAAIDTLGAQSQSSPATAPAPVHVVVFDFVCKENHRWGERLADTIRLKLRRHVDYEVVDRLTTQEVSEPLAVDADTTKLRSRVTERLGAQVGLCGTIRVTGKTFRVHLRHLDLSDPRKPIDRTLVYSDDTQRWRAVIARQIVEAVTAREEWAPPEYGDEPEPDNFGKPVNVNGDFEKGHTGWEHPDNVSTMLVRSERGKGTMLKIRTDLRRDPWLEYTRKLRFGLADPKNPPEIPQDESYGCVGGLEGVHYRGEWIDARAGGRYWLVADAKGQGGAKIFVKGYLDWSHRADGLPETSLVERGLTPRQFTELSPDRRKELIQSDAKTHPERYRREIYRWYLNCGSAKRKWKHFAAPVPPRGGFGANVRWIQIQIYAYWPPGEYYFDNVHLYEDPNQAEPLAEEPARTPSFEKIRVRGETNGSKKKGND